MAELVARPTETGVARSLKVLVELIKEDFEAADEAGIEYYTSAGEKLNEAKDGHFERNVAGFYEWAEEKFGKKRTQIRTYMSLADARSNKPMKSFNNLEDFKRREQGHNRPSSGRMHRDWTTQVDAVAEKARNEARRLAAEDVLTRQQEREAEARLGLRLIDIGYKVLARELHPDKVGGSREAMTRLNKVRERLKSNV